MLNLVTLNYRTSAFSILFALTPTKTWSLLNKIWGSCLGSGAILVATARTAGWPWGRTSTITSHSSWMPPIKDASGMNDSQRPRIQLEMKFGTIGVTLRPTIHSGPKSSGCST